MENKTVCVVCGEEMDPDEAVYCPICGAPHHRECYMKNGECGCSESHGTENEYKKEKPEQEAPKRETQGELSSRILGGYKHNDDLGGVTAGDVGKYVSFNPARYVPLFAKMSLLKKKASFNLFAFFVPEGWFFLRKNYKAGVIISVLLAAAEILCNPAVQFFSTLVAPEKMSEYYIFITENISAMPKGALVLFLLSGALNLAVRLFSGIFGDYVYKNQSFEAVKKYRKQNPKADGNELIFVGGINPFAMIIGFAITSLVPMILISLM